MIELLMLATLCVQEDAYYVEVVRTGGPVGAPFMAGTDGKRVHARGGYPDVGTDLREDDLEPHKGEKLGKMVKAFLPAKVKAQYGEPKKGAPYKYVLRVWYKKDGKNEKVEVCVFRLTLGQSDVWEKEVPQEVKDLILYMGKIASWTLNPSTKKEGDE